MTGSLLNRMIFRDLVRVFALALVTLTGMFLMAGLIQEASQRGLTPTQVVAAIPLLVPSTLPYTVPATTLFAACVVYGRLAADNEVTAVRAAGVHLGRLMLPAVLLGLLTGGGTMGLYHYLIPHTHQMMRSRVLGNVEEVLYAMLKRDGCVRHSKVNYAMWVRQVQGRRLLDAVFKQRDKNGGYSVVARAREAYIHYEPATNSVRVDLPFCTTYGENGLYGCLGDRSWDVPLPKGFNDEDGPRRACDMTWDELLQRRVELVDELPRLEAESAAPRDPTLPAKKREDLSTHYHFALTTRKRESANLEAELQVRPALSFGCLCFALVGAPVGAWFARSDYLSAFVSCFLPIVFAYYPLLLCGSNLAKDGRVTPAVGVWAADALVLAVALGLYWRLVRR
jgi:lipopolysaccharide export system permease protein